MKIRILGSGGYFPNRSRHTACLMLPELGVVLDAGTAAFKIGEHLRTDYLDIYLTHAHLDHIFGLTCLLTLFDGHAKDRIRVHAEDKTIESVRTHLFDKLVFPVDPPCTFRTIQGSNRVAGDGELTTFPLRHPGGSLGFRFDWPGHSLAYVTDTTANPDSEYLEQIRDVDLLIHEAYFNAGEDALARLTGHSCVNHVATLAAEACVKQLVLVHANPLRDGASPLELDSALETFPTLRVAHDDMDLEF